MTSFNSRHEKLKDDVKMQNLRWMFDRPQKLHHHRQLERSGRNLKESGSGSFTHNLKPEMDYYSGDEMNATAAVRGDKEVDKVDKNGGGGDRGGDGQIESEDTEGVTWLLRLLRTSENKKPGSVSGADAFRMALSQRLLKKEAALGSRYYHNFCSLCYILFYLLPYHLMFYSILTNVFFFFVIEQDSKGKHPKLAKILKSKKTQTLFAIIPE